MDLGSTLVIFHFWKSGRSVSSIVLSSSFIISGGMLVLELTEELDLNNLSILSKVQHSIIMFFLSLLHFVTHTLINLIPFMP